MKEQGARRSGTHPLVWQMQARSEACLPRGVGSACRATPRLRTVDTCTCDPDTVPFQYIPPHGLRLKLELLCLIPSTSIQAAVRVWVIPNAFRLGCSRKCAARRAKNNNRSDKESLGQPDL